jgi:hypothetical protein
MNATLPHHQNHKTHSAKPAPRKNSAPPASSVAEEIFSFIAVRDLLLAEAEELTTEANLHRVWMANEFAERCLEPARPPYQAQTLPNADATFERHRCKTVKVRIAELRARVHRHAA